jgi:serine/threonine protein kinase
MPPPAYIQGFEILERIGTGAESAIYRACEISSRRIVALKHVVVDNRENRKYLRHVRNEYNVLRGLQESANGAPPQGIVRVYDLIRSGFLRRHKEHLLVMQFIEGRDLKREGRYPTGQLVHMMIGVCDALAALHRRGFIHGDMKPENIVVDSAGKPTVVDFGFSCKVGSRAETIKGTREYMAPEQVDRRELTEKTDIYNFGASMYFLFAGRHVPAFIPLGGDPSHFIGSRSVDAPPLRTFNASIPLALDEIVRRCVRKDEFDRPSSIEEVQEVLTEVSKRYSDG